MNARLTSFWTTMALPTNRSISQRLQLASRNVVASWLVLCRALTGAWRVDAELGVREKLSTFATPTNTH